MDLEFGSILEQPTSKEVAASPEAQLTVAYLRAIKNKNMRQAQIILEEREIIQKAQELQKAEEIEKEREISSFNRISEMSNALLDKIGDKSDFSIDDLEDTLSLRSDLYREASAKEDLVARRFVVANSYLEDSIISNANTRAPLVMLKQALKDLSAMSTKSTKKSSS